MKPNLRACHSPSSGLKFSTHTFYTSPPPYRGYLIENVSLENGIPPTPRLAAILSRGRIASTSAATSLRSWFGLLLPASWGWMSLPRCLLRVAVPSRGPDRLGSHATVLLTLSDEATVVLLRRRCQLILPHILGAAVFRLSASYPFLSLPTTLTRSVSPAVETQVFSVPLRSYVWSVLIGLTT